MKVCLTNEAFKVMRREFGLGSTDFRILFHLIEHLNDKYQLLDEDGEIIMNMDLALSSNYSQSAVSRAKYSLIKVGFFRHDGDILTANPYMIILPNTSILELKRMRIRWDKWFKD
jgi:predicted transcriptional regulator